jgi:hypothetical protein
MEANLKGGYVDIVVNEKIHWNVLEMITNQFVMYIFPRKQ